MFGGKCGGDIVVSLVLCHVDGVEGGGAGVLLEVVLLVELFQWGSVDV